MSESPPTPVVYEQPLNERMRAFLRLEHLFERTRHQLNGSDVWSTRASLETLIDILSVMGRSDFRKELIKEMERHAATLESLQHNPNVDSARLNLILDDVRGTLSALRGGEGAPGQELRDNELLTAIRQRGSIPAGTCDFDVPSFHFWLQNPPEVRSEQLRGWLATLDELREAVALCLGLVRQSAPATREMAGGGFFQRNLDPASPPCQMVRVVLPHDAPWFPEISAGRHRFTVRFMILGSPEERPTQTEEDVPFQLLCCSI